MLETTDDQPLAYWQITSPRPYSWRYSTLSRLTIIFTCNLGRRHLNLMGLMAYNLGSALIVV